MKLLFLRLFRNFIAILLLFALPSRTWAQSNGFTYQGFLSSGGLPASGSFDIEFTLFGTNVGGTAVVGPITNAATSVSNGYFSVTLDFGEDAFNGSNYWIELGVRTNGGNGFVTLEPRQQITPVPYALFTLNANAAVTANAVAANGVIPVTALPISVVTNGSSQVNFNGTFSGDGSGLTNIDISSLNWDGGFLSNNEVNPTTFSNGVTFGSYALFGSSNTVIGTNLSFFDGSIGVVQDVALTFYAPLDQFASMAVYGNYRNGSNGVRAHTFIGSGIETTGWLALDGNPDVAAIPDAQISMLAVGMDTPNGIITYSDDDYGNAYMIFAGIDDCGCSTNDDYPNGMQTYNIGGNGFVTSWRRNWGNLGVQLELVENDFFYTNIFGFDALSNGLLMGPIVGTAASTNGVHDARSMFMDTNGNVFFGGALFGNGGGLTNLDASQFASGTIPLAQLPATVVTNSSAGVSLEGTFNGDGSGLTNLIYDGPQLIGNNTFVGSQTITGGYLGIGTDAPQVLLHVAGNSGNQLRLQENIGSNYWDIYTEYNLGTNSDNQGNLHFAPGNGAGSFIRVTDGAYITSSDVHLKKDINDLGRVLDRVLQLRPVSYRFKPATETQPKTYGFVAQEVELLFPEVVTEDHGLKGMAYSTLIPVAVGAIQELNQKVEEKEAKLQAQETEIKQLQQSVAELKAAVSLLAQNKAGAPSQDQSPSK